MGSGWGRGFLIVAETCSECGGPLDEVKQFEFRLAGVFNVFKSDGTKHPVAFAMRSFMLCSNECGRESLSKWCAKLIEKQFPESEDGHGKDQ